ncbi:MAG: type II secretion system F family protein [Planctomycetota bacterium]|nr:type II secretion system F family protein [Planctomycetota bacterium]MDA1214981.1 type II secretion system F family protein [Planctomycetota bacterium]
MENETVTTLPIPLRPEFAGILRDQLEFSRAGISSTEEKINRWYDDLILQSGASIHPAVVLMLCLLSAITFGGIMFVVQENLLSAAMATSLGGVFPLGVLMMVRMNRQNKILNQTPAMIEELARAAKTGRSLENCLLMVAQDTPAPLGTELQLCARRLQMGVSIREALQQLSYRTGLVSLNILSMALSVHQQTGGDLVHVLERLSRTIRDRLMFLGRLRAATIASRATAILMLIVPPGILIFFMVRDPEYFTNLMAAEWGKNLTIAAVFLEFIGALWIMRILKNTQRAL